MLNSQQIVMMILAFCIPLTNSQIQRQSDQRNARISDNFNAFAWLNDQFLEQVVPTIRNNEDTLIQEFWTFEEAIGCPACKLFSWTMQRFNSPYVNWAITQYLIVTCEFLTPIIISDMSSRICSGLVDDQFQQMGFPVLFDELLQEQNLCTFILELCDMDKWQPVDVNEWVFDKINEKPKEAITNNFVNELYRKREEDEGKQKIQNSKLIKVVLFSDLHVDYDYKEGSSINCGRIICCRNDSGPAQHKDDAAGYWGEYKCDPPEQLILNMFEFIINEIQPDLALWGGDSIPHNADSLSFEKAMYTMKRVSHQVSEAFLGAGIKVYAAVGNHDTYPLDSFKGNFPGETELVAKWSSSWSSFLDNDQQLKTLRDYGYYSADLKFFNGTKIGKAKVISFNSNFCFFNNFQQYAQFKEPGRIFTWLEEELSFLEKVGGAAIMMAHVPNLDQCNRQFGKRWHALMDRYQHIIRWGMAAHNHDQQWQVARDVVTKQPIGMNFIVGSVTPYQFNRAGKQPSFQVLSMDPETLLPVNIETYSMDIDQANKNEPEWIRNFSDREVYNLKDLSPQSYLEFATKTFSDPEAAQLFKDHMQLLPPSAENNNKQCDHKCQLMIYCMTTSNNFDEHQFCNNHDKFDLFGKSQSESFATPMSIEDLIQHNWYEPKK